MHTLDPESHCGNVGMIMQHTLTGAGTSIAAGIVCAFPEEIRPLIYSDYPDRVVTVTEALRIAH